MATQNEGVIDFATDIERNASDEFHDENTIAERSGGKASIFSSIVNVANTTVVGPYCDLILKVRLGICCLVSSNTSTS